MGHTEISAFGIPMASNSSTVLSRRANGIHYAVARNSVIKHPCARHSLDAIPCIHTYGRMLHALHCEHCTSCKSSREANVPLLQGIEP